MPLIAIDESGCRGCQLCVDICPTDVLAMDEAGLLAKVARLDDCIGCTSCMYLCPSRCLEVSDFLVQRPFYRIERNAALVSKLLQRAPAAAVLSLEDYDEALRDVQTRLLALVSSTADTLGRGQKAFGRRSGQLAASHLPEMYEGRSVSEVLERLRERFSSCFDFDVRSVREDGSELRLSFGGCSIRKIVERSGGRIGEASVCSIFHDYVAGLIGSFTDRSYLVEMDGLGATCEMVLTERQGKS